jgi:hypothetical protein
MLAAQPYSAIREERSSTSPVVGHREQLTQSCQWLGVKFSANIASYVPLDADENGAVGGPMPIFCMRSTSPRLEVGMCASGWAAFRLLLISRGCLVVASFCLGGLVINGDCRFSYTSSVNRARHRAASRGVGITLLGVASPTTSGCPTSGGVSCGSPCTGDWVTITG